MRERECVALTTLRGSFRATYRIPSFWIMQQQGFDCKAAGTRLCFPSSTREVSGMLNKNRIPNELCQGASVLGRVAGMRLGSGKGGMKGNGTNIPLCYRIPNRDCIKRHEFGGGRIILAIGSQTEGGGVERVQEKCFLASARGGRYIPRHSHFPLTSCFWRES